MTKFIFSPVFLFVCLMTLVSSCSLNEFAQRKYYDFPRTAHQVHNSGGETSAAKTKSSITEKIIREEKVVENPSDKKVETEIASTDKLPPAKSSFASSSQKRIKHIINQSSTAPVAAKTIPTTIGTEKKLDLKKIKAKAALKKILFPSGGDLLLLLIAAIFLPFIGVYLKDHRTSKWFWITLLICLAAVGLFSFQFYLIYLWLIASLIAVLHVLDVWR